MLRLEICHSFSVLSFCLSFGGCVSRGAFLAEQSKQAGSCALPQAIENARPCLVEGALVLKYVVVPVCRVPQRMKLERKLRRVDPRVELAKGLRVPSLVLDRVEPGVRKLGYQVANLSRPAVELDCARHEKAAASKDAAAHVVEPGVEHSQKPGQSALALERRLDDFANEYVAGLGDDGKLKFFLRAEVGEQPALAHVKFVGEASDGQAFKAFCRSDMHGGLKNLVPGPGAPGFFVLLLSDLAYCFHYLSFAVARSFAFYYTNGRAVKLDFSKNIRSLRS